MHKLNFIEAAGIRGVQMDGVVLDSPACQSCLVEFQENMRLVLGLAAAPGWSAMITMQWSEAGTKAALKEFGADYYSKLEGATGDEVLRIARQSEIEMGAIVAKSSPLLHSNLEAATRQLEQLVMNCGPFCHGMFEGILKTVCIQAWTAIEVLLEDLVMRVIEQHTMCFNADIKESHHRTIHNIAKQGPRLFFRTRDAFRASYEMAFGSDMAIHAAVNSDSLDALASVRNLLVHKNGIIDKKFIKDEEPKAPTLKTYWAIVEGKRLQFSGEIVRALVDSAVSQCYALLREVNRWTLEKHLTSI